MDNIEHISRARLKALSALGVKKYRREAGAFLVEGETMLREALEAGWKALEVVATEEWLERAELIPALRAQRARLYAGDAEALRKLSDTVNPQSVVAAIAERETRLADLPAAVRRIVVLAGVQDPGNAGAIVRGADAFGLDAVVLTEGSVEWRNPKVLRASMGSCFHIPVVSDVGIEDLEKWLREKEISAIAAVAHGGQDAAHFTAPRAWALMLGNEAAGLPEEIAARCAHRVTLLTPGRAESLNVAVSAGVMMHVLMQNARE
jgi:TrmH family RNA methyltransferase